MTQWPTMRCLRHNYMPGMTPRLRQRRPSPNACFARGKELGEEERFVEARRPLEEAVMQYRALAATDATYRPPLAKALAALAGQSVSDGPTRRDHAKSRVGRRGAGCYREPRHTRPTAGGRVGEEARDLYRALATLDAREYVPRLANMSGCSA